MFMTLRQLCANDNYLYGLRVVAGEEGLDKIVQWVHTLEDEEVGDFLHGGELIFTTGIGHRNSESLDWLLMLVKKLHKNNACGIIINLGPYIKEVTKEVIQYGNDNGFPIFTMPWEVHVVDVTRDFCSQIIKLNKKEDNIGVILQNIIFYPNETEKYIQQLEKNGFPKTENCCMIGVKVKSDKSSIIRNSLFVKQYINHKVKNYCAQVGFFEIQDIMFFVLCNCTDMDLQDAIKELMAADGDKSGCNSFYISVGSNHESLDKLSQNYRRISMMLRLCESENKDVLIYDELGVKKILLSVSDLELLKLYKKDIIGKLEEYDEDNGTNLIDLLRTYIDCNGSIQQVAEINFTHRNTVNYQIKKIKKITGLDISTMEARFEIMLAYHIRDIL